MTNIARQVRLDGAGSGRRIGSSLTARPLRRGMTLLEFMIAITITAMISAAVAAMTTAVARGTEADRGYRETIVRAQALNARLGSYITPSLYMLDVEDESLVIWLDDTREGGTVHATEVRWIEFDGATDSLNLHMVKFPEDWTQVERDLADVELPTLSEWWDVLKTYQDLGFTDSTRLCDRIDAFSVEHQAGTEAEARLVTFTITFTEAAGGQSVVAAAAIDSYQEPTL